jgi:hypothetical protein
MRRPGLMITVVCTILATACGTASAPESDAWYVDHPAVLDEAALRESVKAQVTVAMSVDSSIPASCVDAAAAGVTDVLIEDLGVLGLDALGVTADDASAVSTDAFFQALPVGTRGRVVAVVADCAGLASQLSGAIPGVSGDSLTCLIDQLATAGFFRADAPDAADDAFEAAKAGCFSADEQAAYDAWRDAKAAQGTSVVLSPVDCASVETVRIAEALGFDIDAFEPSLLEMNMEQPVGCTFGNAEEAGHPWALIYVATQDFQRDLYQHYSPLAEVAQSWSSVTDMLDIAGVYFVSRGGSVEWYDEAVTVVFDNGNTTAAVTAGDYVLMVSAGSGDAQHPLTRAELADAAEALAATLALG